MKRDKEIERKCVCESEREREYRKDIKRKKDRKERE